MRRLLTLPLTLLIVIGVWFGLNLIPVSSTKVAGVEFAITKGQSVDQIGNNLLTAGLIRSPLAFKISVYLLRLSPKIQAGYFFLYPSQSTVAIAQGLTKASTKQVWITIPEGLRRQEIANLIIDKLQAAKIKHSFDPDLFIKATGLIEGQLFPETYAFPEGVDTQKAINLLHGQFIATTKRLGIPDSELNRVVILASLVEKEAGADSERAMVAGIITNRLIAKWPLQIDASVQYALSTAKCRIRICDWWPNNLTKADLTIVSPFNTYLNASIPPSPIANPGEASLRAAFNPQVSKYFFYLHGLDGQIHYAATVSEHNKNVCLYLKKNC